MKISTNFIRFFSSIKVTVILLILLTLASILGTVIPQNNIPEFYLHLYGQFFFRFFNLINLFDMYHSWWYHLMFFLLFINIGICTLWRLPNLYKSVFSQDKYKISKIKNFSQNFEILVFNSFEKVYKVCHSFLKDEFGSCSVTKVHEGIILKSDSGKWTRFGAHIAHLSILLLLLGGLLGFLFGFEGYTNIQEGEVVNWIRLKKNEEIKKLDFKIRCDLFGIDFHENGSPKQYVSKLAIIKNDKIVINENIRVNTPLNYEGIKIFQSSYGRANFSLLDKSFLFKELEIDFLSKNTEYLYNKKLKLGLLVDLPEKMGNFCILDYLPNASFNGLDLGPTIKSLYLYPDGSSSEEILLPINFDNFDSMRGGKMTVLLTNKIKEIVPSDKSKLVSYYTGLQITQDPGKYIVYVSFLFIVLGFIIAVFFSHRQIYIKVSQERRGIKIVMTGHTNRNKLIIKSIINKFQKTIKFANLNL